RGLEFGAFWLDADGEKSPALLPGAGQQLLASEREKVIRLTSLARKAHFRFIQETQKYLLTDAIRVQAFLKQDLAAWRKFFRVELDSAVARLNREIKPVEVEARARVRPGGDLNLEWIFRSGQVLLSEADAAALLKAEDGGAVLLPEIGFVELSREKRQAVQEWTKRLE